MIARKQASILRISIGAALGAAFLFLGFINQAQAAMTLDECFNLALKQNESLKIKEEDIKAAEARYKQALGGILPNLNFLLTETFQDTSRIHSQPAVPILRESTVSNFQLKQPLFKGLKEFSAMSGFKHQSKSFDLAYRRAVADLYLDVAQAFYQVAGLETAVNNLDVLIKLTVERVTELNNRAKLGKSRESEILTAESQVYALKSTRAQTVGNLTAARELLGFFAGQDLSATPLDYQLRIEEEFMPLDQALEKGEERYDLKAERETVEVQRFAVRASKADYWPTLDATADYYTKRKGLLAKVDWDVLLDLDVPIYQGGAVQGRVREAMSGYSQAKLQYEQMDRQVKSDVKTSHAQLLAVIEAAKTLSDAYTKAKRSYELQVREYRLGLVNNLDVLQAMNSMQQLKQNLDGSTLNTQLGVINLQAAIDALPFETNK